jgi:hypothetical protein
MNISLNSSHKLFASFQILKLLFIYMNIFFRRKRALRIKLFIQKALKTSVLRYVVHLQSDIQSVSRYINRSKAV